MIKIFETFMVYYDVKSWSAGWTEFNFVIESTEQRNLGLASYPKCKDSNIEGAKYYTYPCIDMNMTHS